MNKRFEYQPLIGFQKYTPGEHLTACIKIDNRIQAIKNGEVKTQSKKGTVLLGFAARAEIERLENLKPKFQEASKTGKISTDLLDQIMFF